MLALTWHHMNKLIMNLLFNPILFFFILYNRLAALNSEAIIV